MEHKLLKNSYKRVYDNVLSLLSAKKNVFKGNLEKFLKNSLTHVLVHFTDTKRLFFRKNLHCFFSP